MIFLHSSGVSAGSFSAPVDEHKGGMISLESFLLPHPKRTFMVRVQGDSMKGEGICSGDYVLVERGVTPVPGKIIVARHRDRMVIKQWCLVDHKAVLRSAHAGYPDIPISDEIEAIGTVVAVVRKYV